MGIQNKRSLGSAAFKKHRANSHRRVDMAGTDAEEMHFICIYHHAIDISKGCWETGCVTVTRSSDRRRQQELWLRRSNVAEGKGTLTDNGSHLWLGQTMATITEAPSKSSNLNSSSFHLLLGRLLQMCRLKKNPDQEEVCFETYC